MGQPDRATKIAAIENYLKRAFSDFSVQKRPDEEHGGEHIRLYRVPDGTSHQVIIRREFLEDHHTLESLQGFLDQHALAEKVRCSRTQLVMINPSGISLVKHEGPRRG